MIETLIRGSILAGCHDKLPKGDGDESKETVKFNLKKERGERENKNTPGRPKAVIQTRENVPDSLVISRKRLEKPAVPRGENGSWKGGLG